MPSGIDYIYIAWNPEFPHLVKIGKTNFSPKFRVRQLSMQTGAPAPFRLIFSQQVYDYHRIERLIHRSPPR